jgi:hypothetical protein
MRAAFAPKQCQIGASALATLDGKIGTTDRSGVFRNAGPTLWPSAPTNSHANGRGASLRRTLTREA